MLGVSARFHSICVLRAVFELATDQADGFTDSLLDADCLVDFLDNQRTEAKDCHTALILKASEAFCCFCWTCFLLTAPPAVRLCAD